MSKVKFIPVRINKEGSFSSKLFVLNYRKLPFLDKTLAVKNPSQIKDANIGNLLLCDIVISVHRNENTYFFNLKCTISRGVEQSSFDDNGITRS